MKKILLLLFALFILLHAKAQIFSEISSIIYPGSYPLCCSAAWGDYNNDGFIDYIVMGEYIGTKLFKNNGNNTFTEQTGLSFTGSFTSAAWGDFNNDGFLDLAFSNGKIFKNNGNETFTQQTSITGLGWGSVSWGDYNNDGFSDILISGDGSSPSGTFTKIFKNNGNDTFSELFGVTLTGISSQSASSNNLSTFSDYNNDGNLDIFLAGGSYSGSVTPKVYKNNGDETFSLQTISGFPTSTNYAGSVALGDYNNDSYLDLLLTGNTGGQVIAQLYKNNSNGIFNYQSGISLTPIGQSCTEFGDYDNDGFADILLSGSTVGSKITKVFKNNGDETFSDQTAISLLGGERSQVNWVDIDNDGKLDIHVVTVPFYNSGGGIYSQIYRNNILTSNLLPSAPTGLFSTVINNTVLLKWNRASDDHTPQKGLSYNIYIGSSSGSVNIVSPMADISTGKRRVSQIGNTCMDTAWTIKKLNAGIHYWSVQAIDNSYTGSPFASEGTFSIPLIVDAGANQTIICGGNAQLNVIPTNLDNGAVLTYAWTPSTSLNATDIANPIASPSQTTTYTVNVTYGTFTAVDSVTIIINPLTANAGIDKSIICGGTASLNSVTTNYTGLGTLNYAWLPVVGLNNASLINPTAKVIINTTYTVTVSTDNGCTATDQIVVNVNPLIANAGSDKITTCLSPIQLNSVSTNYTGSDILSYSWSNALLLNNALSQQPIATTNNNTIFTVTVTTDNGCIATDYVNVSLQIMSSPEICIVDVSTTNKNMLVWNKIVSVAIDSFYIYKETNVTNIYEKIGAVDYNALSIFIDSTSHPSIQSSRYKISIKDMCNLESPYSLPHKTMHLSINQGQGNIWNLIWEPYTGFIVSTYNIYRGTDPNNLQLIGTTSSISTQYSDFSAPSGYVYYQVEVVSPNMCSPSKSYNSSRSNKATNNPSAIDVTSIDNSIIIYPNPTDNYITIETPSSSSIEIISSQGKIIRNLILTNLKNTIDLKELNSGIYTLKIITDKKTIVKKLIKQ